MIIPFGDDPTVLPSISSAFLREHASICSTCCQSIPNHVYASTESTDHAVRPMTTCNLFSSTVSNSSLAPLDCSHSELHMSLNVIQDFINTKCLTWGWQFHSPLGNLKVCHCSAEHSFFQFFLQTEVLISHKKILGFARHTSLGSFINYTSLSMREIFRLHKI